MSLPRHSDAQYLFIQGSRVTPGGVKSHDLRVLAKDPPQLTDGWSNYNVINVPQERAITVLAGYNPMQMALSVTFECLQRDWLDEQNGTPNEAAGELERQIEILDWFGGRGKLGLDGSGDSPLLTVRSINAGGYETPLIPPTVQGLQWVNNGAIAYDANPVRNRHGYRVRQDATMTLLQWNPNQFSGSADSPVARAQAAKGLAGQYKVIKTTSGLNTIQKIAGSIGDPAAAFLILRANKDNTKLGTSVHKQLPVGTRVKVPLSVIAGLAQ